MSFRHQGEIEFFQFNGLGHHPVTQAIFTRAGGVSPAPWKSLNVGGTVGDDPGRVAENLRRSLAVLGKDLGSLFEVWQVHSAVITVATAPRDAGEPLVQADGVMTDNPAVTLFMRYADCVPIMLYEPARHVIGLVHAGWKGTVLDAAGAAVRAMHEHFDVTPEDIWAGIGPSIGPDHYPVGPDVATTVNKAFGDQADQFLSSARGETLFNLWQANCWLLERAGVGKVELAGHCTACEPSRWFSHRGERGQTGRFGALISLSSS